MSVLLSLIKEMFFRRSISRGNAVRLSATDHDLQVAVDHHQAGRLNDAETIYRAILQVQPQNPDANFNLGELFLQTHQSEAARSFLEAALEINPGNSQHWQSLTECLVQLQAWNEVAALLNDAEAEGLKLPDAARLMGQSSARVDHIKQIEAAKSRFPVPQGLGPIVDRWMGVELDSYMTQMDAHLNVISNDFVAVSKLLGR